MIIQCKKYISQTSKEKLDNLPWLAKDKYYIALALVFKSDMGLGVFIQPEGSRDPCLVYLDGFEIITQTLPKNWVTTTERVFENYDEIIMLPESWNYPGFFEDLDDHEPKAVELFIKEATKIYNEEVCPDWLEIEDE